MSRRRPKRAKPVPAPVRHYRCVQYYDKHGRWAGSARVLVKARDDRGATADLKARLDAFLREKGKPSMASGDRVTGRSPARRVN